MQKLMYFVRIQVCHNGRIRKATRGFKPLSKRQWWQNTISFWIGTKLIVGFLIIATITGLGGYLSLNYAQTVGEKFDLLQKQTLPTINSLGQMKVAALNIEADTNEFFIPGVNREMLLQDLTQQK